MEFFFLKNRILQFSFSYPCQKKNFEIPYSFCAGIRAGPEEPNVPSPICCPNGTSMCTRTLAAPSSSSSISSWSVNQLPISASHSRALIPTSLPDQISPEQKPPARIAQPPCGYPFILLRAFFSFPVRCSVASESRSHVSLRPMPCVSDVCVAAVVVSFRLTLDCGRYGFTPGIQRVGVWSGWSPVGHALEMIWNGMGKNKFVLWSWGRSCAGDSGRNLEHE